MRGFGGSSRKAPETRIITMGDGDVEIVGIPRIEITHEALERLWTYIAEYSKEIAGLGYVERVGDATYRITQVVLVEQWGNTGAHVDITEGAVRFAERLAVADQSSAPYRCWWHSHVDMGAYWSDVDEGTAQALGFDYLIAIVANKRREFRCRFQVSNPVRIVFDNLPLFVTTGPIAGLTAAVRADIAKFVHRDDGLSVRSWASPEASAQYVAPSVPPLSPESAALVAARSAVAPVPTVEVAASPVPAATVAPVATIPETAGERLARKVLYDDRRPMTPVEPAGDALPISDAPARAPYAAPRQPNGTSALPPARVVTAPSVGEPHFVYAQVVRGSVAQFSFAFGGDVTYLDRATARGLH